MTSNAVSLLNAALVLDFTEPAAALVAETGGKGASLAKMSGAGFPVPPGFVVTARAYRAFMSADAGFAAQIAALDPADTSGLVAQCAAMRERIRTRTLPSALEADLRTRLPALLARGPVAVRSSSTMEDLAGAAFAGQHDTFLHVSGADAVLEKVRACFASLWEDRAVRYRHERGFDHAAASMAVVVQSMVHADAAGVAFCLHPVTGDLGQVVVNSAWGLGETVVSGEGDVDQFVVDKKSGAIVEKSIAEKTHRIVGVAQGTKTEEVPAAQQSAPSLTDAQLDALRTLANAVERFYGFPQDLEWGIQKGELFLLQARPVTRFPARWTRDESAERFPNVTTPLAWDFVSDGFHESLAASLELMGLPAFGEHWFERFDGYIYGNQTAVKLFTGGQGLAFDSLDELRAMIPALRSRYRSVQHLPVTWMRDLDHYLLSIGRFAATNLRALPDERAVWEHVQEIDAAGRQYFRPNIAISITQGLLHRTLFRVVAMVTPPADAPARYDALTSFCETKTNLVNRDLHRLTAMARGEPALRALLLDTDRRRIVEERRLDAFPAFASAFGKFLRDHGHREVDWDVYVPTWSGQPWVVLENLRLMLARTDGEDPAEREEALRLRQSDAETSFLAAIPADLHFVAAELLRLARAYTALDDLEHYQTTRLSAPFRDALVELGRRFATRRALSTPEDVFFLQKKSVLALVRGEMTPAAGAAEATKNKSDYAAWKSKAPLWVLGENAPPAGAGALRGLPGSPGVAEGPVFRVHGVEDFSKFPAGSVLVARTTNPAWTPLFYTAVAVVTESGGPLSHGAVTAREVGLPAVMAVRSALSVFSDGQRVRVNGSAGTVELL